MSTRLDRCITMAALLEEPISLSDEQTSVLIDLWEAQPLLWDPKNRAYKDRNQRFAVRLEIAEKMGNGWTEGQVERKLKSLKGHYNTSKRMIKKESSAGSRSCDGGVKVPWVHFHKINAFMHDVQYYPAARTSAARSDGLGQLSENNEDDNDGETDEMESASLSDALILRNNVRDGGEDTPASLGSSTPSPARKRHASSPAPHSSSSQTADTTLHMPIIQTANHKKHAFNTSQTSTKRKQSASQNDGSVDSAVSFPLEHETFASYCAERLRQIDSKRTVVRLKSDIDKMLNDALLAEMSDSSALSVSEWLN